MKKSIKIVFLILASSAINLLGCPTCVGHINKETPPFFSDEFYKPDTGRMDELYEQYLQKQHQTTLESDQANQKEEK